MDYMKQAVESMHICGDGDFTKKCSRWIEEQTGTGKCLLTTSCTHALEMAALLCDIKEGDEVIMPSYTFVSTADAFVLRGARIVFVDIRPDTMNIDETLIEDAITEKTKAIAVVHYAGVSCEMDTILDIAKRHQLLVVEDAAQGVMASYKGKALGTIGDFGCFSFHETKNYSMGEGGALLIRDEHYVEEAEIDHGTISSVYTEEMCLLMRRLVSLADIVTPNLTEGCRLTDVSYRGSASCRLHSSRREGAHGHHTCCPRLPAHHGLHSAGCKPLPYRYAWSTRL